VLQVPPEKVFKRPQKTTPNTVSEGVKGAIGNIYINIPFMDLLNGFVCGNTVDISRIIHDHPKGTLT
jgi:hypothetical protein